MPRAIEPCYCHDRIRATWAYSVQFSALYNRWCFFHAVAITGIIPTDKDAASPCRHKVQSKRLAVADSLVFDVTSLLLLESKVPCKCWYIPPLNSIAFISPWRFSPAALSALLKIFVLGIKKCTSQTSIFLIPLPFHTTCHFWSRLPGGFPSVLKNTKKPLISYEISG